MFEARRSGDAGFSSSDLQILVKSSMVMDKAEHTALLRRIVSEASATPRDDRVRLHLSGHFCHAPRPELLQAIEDCGAVVVDDDLYHGTRYISTDVAEGIDPVAALADWYLQRDVNVPCPTRVKHGADWEDHLLQSVEASGAQGVIVLMAKFCEPHMLYYPELRRRLTERGVPHLLIETEHEGIPSSRSAPASRRSSNASAVPSSSAPEGRDPMSTAVMDSSNRLGITKAGGRMVADYWDGVFTARERGEQVVWYNGSAVNPIFQAAGLVWCHGEAFSARLAAQHLEGPAQLAGQEYGYIGELCSYARTHLGCAVLTRQSRNEDHIGVVGLVDQQELASRLPMPDFFVNAYAGCSTGQQWDTSRCRSCGATSPTRATWPARSGSRRRGTSPTSCTS